MSNPENNAIFCHVMSYNNLVYHIVFRTYRSIPVVKQYIINQKEHHRQVTFTEEYRRFFMDYGGEIDERFFLKD